MPLAIEPSLEPNDDGLDLTTRLLAVEVPVPIGAACAKAGAEGMDAINTNRTSIKVSGLHTRAIVLWSKVCTPFNENHTTIAYRISLILSIIVLFKLL